MLVIAPHVAYALASQQPVLAKRERGTGNWVGRLLLAIIYRSKKLLSADLAICSAASVLPRANAACPS